MTDYRISGKNKSSYSRSSTSKWQAVVAIFIVSFFVFALFFEVVKSSLVKKDINVSSWDGVSSFVLGLGDSENSLLIFQNDPKRVVLVKTGLLGSGLTPDAFSKKASVVFGTSVENYLKLGNLNESEIKNKFDNFISIATPIKLLTTGWSGNSMNTNITRTDALKLWWQLKAIRSKDLEFVNLTSYATKETEKSNDKVLGITNDFLNHEISKYLENTKIIDEDIDLKIVNAGGDSRAAYLAENFIVALGGRVASVNGDVTPRVICNIETNAGSSYTARYLAKIFRCDINDAMQTDDKPSLTLYLGVDFSARYF